jgi:hypothetical protein
VQDLQAENISCVRHGPPDAAHRKTQATIFPGAKEQMKVTTVIKCTKYGWSFLELFRKYEETRITDEEEK